jgi:hypothetical protein
MVKLTSVDAIRPRWYGMPSVASICVEYWWGPSLFFMASASEPKKFFQVTDARR